MSVVSVGVCTRLCVFVYKPGPTGDAGRQRRQHKREGGVDRERERKKEGKTRPSFRIQGGGVDR